MSPARAAPALLLPRTLHLPSTAHPRHALAPLLPAAQTVFAKTIRQPGAGDKEVSELFSFRRPSRPRRANASALLNLTSKQHDALYALAGAWSHYCANYYRQLSFLRVTDVPPWFVLSQPSSASLEALLC